MKCKTPIEISGENRYLDNTSEKHRSKTNEITKISDNNNHHPIKEVLYNSVNENVDIQFSAHDTFLNNIHPTRSESIVYKAK